MAPAGVAQGRGRRDPRLPLADRREAGRLLARSLDFLRGAPGLLVLALPRGGVPVAYEIAQALHAPLDVLVVRKIGMPGHAEYAIGALASGPGGGTAGHGPPPHRPAPARSGAGGHPGGAH